MPNKTCYQYALDLIARRDYSKFKLAQKLRSKEYESEEIEEAIEMLIERNYLREEEYARLRVQGLLLKGYANSYIKQKCSLEKLKVDDDFIDSIRQDRGIETNDEIHRLIEKKLRGKEIPQNFEEKMKLQNKVIHFLVSKGHNYPEVKAILNKYLESSF